MKKSELFGKIERGIHGLTKIISRVAMTVLFLMMMLVTADVIGRFIFNRPIIGGMEINELMMVVLVFFGLAYCTLEKGHTQVDLLFTRFSMRTQAILDSFISFFSAVIFALIGWQVGMQGLRGLSDSVRVSPLLGIPEAPFMLIAALGSLLACLEMLVNIVRSLGKAIKWNAVSS